MRSEYQRRLAGHCRQAEIICQKLGAAFHRLVTDQPLELALVDFLRGRNRRNKLIRRRAPGVLVNMSFLTPWFLLGALAVAGPVLFHLIRRSARERMPFSSLLFLRPTPPRATRRRKLEHIALLLLRCLGLLLLAAGFARPFFPKGNAFAAACERRTPDRRAIGHQREHAPRRFVAESARRRRGSILKRLRGRIAWPC